MTDKDDEQKPAEFWEDEQPGQVYIKPNLEMNLTPKQKQDCRDIALEIRKFGINYRQRLFLLELLSLECEDNNLIRQIKAAINESRETFGKQQDSGLIIPGSSQE